MFDIKYSPDVPGCITNSKGETLCELKGEYYKWNGGLAHRIVWEAFNGKIPSGHFVDHINRNKLDNRIENLRLATRSQNVHNSYRPKKDGLPRGISKSGRKFCATLTVNKVTHRQLFVSLNDAIEWRVSLGKELMGEYFTE